jgi:hypothetical protein
MIFSCILNENPSLELWAKIKFRGSTLNPKWGFYDVFAWKKQ